MRLIPPEILTPYVSALRYPGGADDPMPSREEFDEALQHVRTIYDFMRQYAGLTPACGTDPGLCA